MKKLTTLLTRIAREHLGIETLETRRSDRLDFREVAVWCVKDALLAAYHAGVKSGADHPACHTASAVPGLPTPFDAYEIHGIRAYGRGRRRYYEQVPDSEAQSWSLFGHIPGQGLDCIGDFATRQQAEEVYARITGRPYAIGTRRAG